MFALTEQQTRAIHSVAQACISAQQGFRPCHFVLEAVAGSGKSKTLINVVKHVIERQTEASILLLQFNQEACAQMKQHLKQLLSDSIHVHTLHSFGLKMLGGTTTTIDPEKIYKIWFRLRGVHLADTEEARQEWLHVQREVSRMRHSACLPSFTERPLTLPMSVLQASVEDRVTLDQEDAVYHSLYYNVVADSGRFLVRNASANTNLTHWCWWTKRRT